MAEVESEFWIDRSVYALEKQVKTLNQIYIDRFITPGMMRSLTDHFNVFNFSFSFPVVKVGPSFHASGHLGPRGLRGKFSITS